MQDLKRGMFGSERVASSPIVVESTSPPQPQISWRVNSDDEIVDFIETVPPSEARSLIQLTAVQTTRYLEKKGNDTQFVTLLAQWPTFFSIESAIERDQFLRLLLTHGRLFARTFSDIDDATWAANEEDFAQIALNTLDIVAFLERALPDKRFVLHSLFATYIEHLVDCARAMKQYGASSAERASAEKRLRKYAAAMERIIRSDATAGGGGAGATNDSEHVSVVLFEPKQATISAAAELLKTMHGPGGTGTHLNLKIVRLHGFHQTDAVRDAIAATRRQNIHKVVVIAVGVRATSAVMKYLGTLSSVDASPVRGVIFFQALGAYDDELDGNLVERIFHKLVDKPLADFEHFTKQINYDNLKHSAPYLIIDTEQENLDEIKSMTSKSKDADVYTFKHIDGADSAVEFAKEVEYFVRQFENEYY